MADPSKGHGRLSISISEPEQMKWQVDRQERGQAGSSLMFNCNLYIRLNTFGGDDIDCYTWLATSWFLEAF